MYGNGSAGDYFYRNSHVIAPLLIIYLVAQKGFVESLAQTGIKM